MLKNKALKHGESAWVDNLRLLFYFAAPCSSLFPTKPFVKSGFLFFCVVMLIIDLISRSSKRMIDKYLLNDYPAKEAAAKISRSFFSRKIIRNTLLEIFKDASMSGNRRVKAIKILSSQEEVPGAKPRHLNDPDIESAVMNCLGNKDPEGYVRKYCAWLLMEMNSDERATRILVEAYLDDEDREVKKEALKSFSCHQSQKSINGFLRGIRQYQYDSDLLTETLIALDNFLDGSKYRGDLLVRTSLLALFRSQDNIKQLDLILTLLGTYIDDDDVLEEFQKSLNSDRFSGDRFEEIHNRISEMNAQWGMKHL